MTKRVGTRVRRERERASDNTERGFEFNAEADGEEVLLDWKSDVDFTAMCLLPSTLSPIITAAATFM